MLGAIIGDIVGSRFEFNNHRSKEFELFDKACAVTDDGIMTIAVARAIIEAGTPPVNDKNAELQYYAKLEEMTVKYLRAIGQDYPNCGYGGMFVRWMFSDNPEPYNSFGNGAAMRIRPVAFIARTEDEALRMSQVITGVTHNHAEGIKGAAATVIAIFMARNGYSKHDIYNRINDEYYSLDFTIDGIRGVYKFNETCQGTVPQAIKAFLEANSFEDAIRIAISLGGDSDTLAAITGAIAEAYYGVPEEIGDTALEYLDTNLRAIYELWVEYAGEM